MNISDDNPMLQGAASIINLFGVKLPWLYTSVEDEYLACRKTAWLGVNLNTTPVYEVSGSDAAAVLERTCTNKDFAGMTVGRSKHALICNEKGHLLADGVCMKKEDCYRTYWLAPVLQYYVEKAKAEGLDVDGQYRTDEYFFQIDGPKSLEILEDACQCDLHDIKFARNKTVQCCGTPMTVHRLGMSGCLAYEVHGSTDNFDVVYSKLRETVEKYGGRPQGVASYGIVNHTPGGYPNQLQHYCYAFFEGSDTDFQEFAKKYCIIFPTYGSAWKDQEAYYVTPYEIGWGNLVKFDKCDYQGKQALEAAKDAEHRVCVTLEWNAEDCADVFMSQISGTDVEPYDNQILYPSVLTDSENGAMRVRGDYVMDGDKVVGLASGRTFAYYERRMISLAWVQPQYAAEGTELAVDWSSEKFPHKKMIRVKVAKFPYFDGEWRNETCDVDKMVPKRF